MKSITKRIISTLVICGALVLEAGATTFSSIGKGLNNIAKVDADSSVTFTVGNIFTDSDDGKAKSSLGTIDKITITGSGSSNNTKYYKSDKTWRFYSSGGGAINVSCADGYYLTSVALTGTSYFSTAPTNWSYNNSVFTPNSGTTPKTVSLANGNGTSKISKIVVTYTSSSSSSYTVTYNGNGNTGGSVPTDSTSYSSGASVTVKDNTGSLVKTGFTFNGWNTQADGKGTSYSAGSTFNITANTTLYANWKSSGGGTEEQIIIDASTLNLNSDGVTSETSYGGYTFAPKGSSNKVKSYGGDNRKNNFSDNGAILIGKKGAYLYNTAGFAQKAVKFEMYWNIGGSTSGSLSLGIQFSDSPLTSYSTGTNTYTNSGALTQDSVYDLSSYLTSNCKYFYLKVNSDHNAQVQFRVTLEKAETKTITSIAVKQAPSKTTYYEGETFDPTGLVITATYNDASTSDFSYAEHGSDFAFNPKLTDLLTTDDTTVTITYGGKTVDQAITVNETLDPYISSVEITKSATNVLTHQDITASAKVTVENDPSSTLSKNVNWVQSSEDGGEVTFSKSTSASEEQITISGKTAGTVTIQAKSAVTPTVLDYFTLTVGKNIVVTGVSINGGDINKTSGYINDTQDLTATVSYQYDEGTNAVNWESSQPTVVSVDATGKIKFLANTTSAVTITATSAENTEKSASISVTASNLEQKPQIAGLKDGHKYFILSSDDAILTAKAVNKTHADYTSDYAFNQGKNKPFTSTATVTSGKVTAIAGVEGSDLGEYAFTFTNVDDNQWKIGNGTNVIGNGNANNGMSMNDSTGLVYTCSESSSTGGTKAKDGFYNLKSDRYIAYYSDGPDWRTYSNLDNGDPNIYFIEYVAPVKPDTLTLDTDEYTFTSISGTKVVTPTVLGPDSAVVTGDYEIEWESTNEECATVAKNTVGNGEITPVGAGTSTITATIDGKYTESGNDLVESVEITVRTFSINYTGSSILKINDQVNLTNYLSVSPAFSSGATYTWTSSNSTNLSVNNGLVTALAVSSNETITCTVVDNGYTYTDSVSFEILSNIVPPTHVALTKNSSTLTLGGSPDTVTATVYGENEELATSQEITLTGYNSSIVSVTKGENNLLTISPVGAGSTVITVNFAGGTEATKKTISVVVENAPITSIVLSANKTEIFGDEEVEITATPNEHASLDGVEFTVTPAIATVTHKEGNVYTLTANDKYVGGTVSVTASDGNVTSNALSIDIVDYLNYIGYVPTITESVESTLTASKVTSDTTLKDDQNNVYTVTADGNYTSNTNFIQVGTNDKTVSYIKVSTGAFSSKKITKIQVWGTSKANTGVTPKIYIGGNLVGEGEAYATQTASSGGTEFAVENTKNYSGDILIEISRENAAVGAIYFNKLIVTCEESKQGEEINLSNTNIEMQKQVVEYARWLNENYSDGIEPSDWEDISSKYSEVLGSLEGENLELAQYMFKHAIASTGTDTDCLQNCVSLYDAAAKKYNLVDSSNNFMGRTLEATTYAYSYDVGEGTATGGSDTGNYVYGSEITLPSVSYDGYRFDGWYTDSGFTTPLVNTDGKFNMPAGAVTAYAKWVALETVNVDHSSIDTSKINYSDSGQPAYLGSNFVATILPQKGYENVELTITMNEVTLVEGEDYTYNSTNGELVIENITGDIVINATASLIPEEYDVKTYGDDHVTVSADSETVTAGGSVTITVTPDTYNHYHVDVVTYTMGGGEPKIATLDANNQFTITNVSGDIVVNATSAIDTYSVTYKPGTQGSGDEHTDTKTGGVDLTLADALFTREGYTQVGWATSDGGEKVYDLKGTYSADAGATLYPVWEANTYTVTPTPDTGSYINVNTSVAHGSDLVVEVGALENYHLVSISYTVAGEAESHSVDPADLVEGKFTIEGVTGNVTITVTSAKDTVSVTTTLNDSTAQYDITSVEYGGTYTNTFTATAGYSVESVTYQIGDAEPVTVTGNTVTINNVTDALKVTVNTHEVTVTGITVVPTEVTVEFGEDVNLNSLVVTATYSDGSSKPVTGFTVVDYDKNHAGVYTAHVTYTEGDATVSCDLIVTVKDKVVLDSISVDPTSVTIAYGGSIDTSILTVTAHYSDGGEVTVTDFVLGNYNAKQVGEQDVTITYQGETCTLKLVVEDKVIDHIEVVEGSYTTSVYQGDEYTFDGKVNVYYVNDEEPVEISEGFTVSEIDTSNLGEKTLTVSYGGKTAEVTINVVAKTITGIEVANNPDKIEYTEGEEFNPAGLVITVVYDNGKTENVTYNETTKDLFSFSVTGKLALGTDKVVVTYADKTADIAITVNAKTLESISVEPTSINIDYGTSINVEDLTVTATYSNGSTGTVTGFTLSAYDSKAPGTQTVTITYQDKTCELTVVVANPVVDHIEVVEGSYATSVEQGDTYTFGGKINVYYVNGGEEPVEVTSGFEVSTIDTSTVGAKTLTVTYGGKTASVTITVVAKPVQPTVTELVVTDYTNKIEVGGTYTFDGIVVAKYSDGTEETLEASQYTVSALDTSTEGEKTVTITFGEKTKDITVTVYKPEQPTPQDPPMSTGAKVGIGVGAACGSLGLAVGLFFLIKLFKLKK